MSPTTQWIVDQGIPPETIMLLLFIPIFATIVNIARYIIGFKTFGIYAPIILSLSFYFIGIRNGVLITTVVIISSIVNYSILKKVRMHYASRIAINYVLITIVILLFAVITSQFEQGQKVFNINGLNPLAIISIAALSDFFIKQYVKKNFNTTVRSLVETIITSVIGIALLRSQLVQEFVFNNLWIPILLIIINVGIGQFTGLKITDYLRFSEVISSKVKTPDDQ